MRHWAWRGVARGEGGYERRRVALEVARRWTPFDDPFEHQDALLARLARERQLDEMASRVSSALETALPPRQREAVRLTYFECLGEREVAAAMGVTRARAYNDARDGLRRLQAHFAGRPLRDWRRGARRTAA